MNEETSPPPQTGYNWRIRLASVLVGGITVLVVIAVGSVLLITLLSATRNTFELIADRSENTLDILEARIERQLGPAVDAASEFASQFADGRLNVEHKRENTFHAFAGALSSNPHMTALLFVSTDGSSLIVSRREGFPVEIAPDSYAIERQEFAIRSAREARTPFWVPPLWVPAVERAILAHVTPVWRGDELLGVVVASLTLAGISDFLDDLQRKESLNAFILYNQDRVLAHPRLDEAMFERPKTPAGIPLPRVQDFPEPSFHMLADGGDKAVVLLEYAANIHDARSDGEFVIITRNTEKYGIEPWIFGVILERDIVGREIVRLRNSALAGFAILLIAVLLGFLFARRLNRQIGGLVRSAGALTELEIASAPEVPDSRITELSDAARAFNRMIAALRLLETYIPRQLVLRLMQSGEDISQSEERVLTIMFTDIRGFSTLAEHMDAGEIARLLNAHFDMLAEAIEAESGTVDKYIGDAIMAFWGAPEHLHDHAARALRAAAEIQRRVRADNEIRRASGAPLLAVRVGVHTGPVIVGNIGSRSRVNYTIVGDTVNTASRIDSLAKELAADEDCIVLVSGDTQTAAGTANDGGFTMTNLGEHEIRGRTGTVGIHRLDAND
jgi:adenylate cyclase